jgi:hypothetical protein
MRGRCGRRVFCHRQHIRNGDEEGDAPWSDEMCDCEENTKNDAKTADDDVCNAQEGVLASHNRSRGDEDGFGTTVDCDREVWRD